MNSIIPLDYFLLLAVPLVFAAGVISWICSRGVRPALRLGMTATRSAGVGAVLALLLNPGQWREWEQGLVPCWAIMLDRSASMRTADAGEGGGRTRWEEGREIAAQAIGLSAHPERIRLYAFDGSAAPVDPGKLAAVQPDGDKSLLVKSGQEVLALEQGRNGLRGVILISDGRQPIPGPAEPFALRAAARGAPLYPVVLGGDVLAGDLVVRAPRRRYVSFLGQPVTLQASLENTRMGPLEARLTLRERGREPLQDKTVFVTNGQSQAVSFELKSARPGYYDYEVEAPVREGESDRVNNTVHLEVIVLNAKLNVLILEGEPYWDTKFLSHLLRGQTNMSVTAVFRVTKDRYFKVSSEQALSSVKDDVFPETDEAMAAYDLVVIGRGSDYLIDEGRAQLLTRFVKDQGGCLFFARGKSYTSATSPLSSLEPVEWGKELNASFGLKPLLAGDLAGLFGGLLPEKESPLWNELPLLERGTRCESLKDFSEVLADAVPKTGSSQGAFPGLISRRHGRGLVLLINGDGLWKWGFFPKAWETHDIYRNLWIRLFQWAVSFSEFNPGADYAVQVDRGAVRAGEPVRVRVMAKTPSLAMPGLRLFTGDRFVRDLPLSPDGDKPGRWIGVVMQEEPGLYRVSVETAGGPVAGVQAAVQVLPPPSEDNERSADPAFMGALAHLSGGRVTSRAELPDLVRSLELPLLGTKRDRVEWDPAWDRASLALAMALCFSMEWFWRRKNGLP